MDVNYLRFRVIVGNEIAALTKIDELCGQQLTQAHAHNEGMMRKIFYKDDRSHVHSKDEFLIN